MPALDAFLNSAKLPNRIFIYGPSQSRKTLWAGTLADAGYNLLVLSGDGNGGILRNVSAKGRQRIFLADIRDTRTHARMHEAIHWLAHNGHVWLNENDRMVTAHEAGGSTHIDIREWNTNFVVVLDSWTVLAQSTQFKYAIDNKIDLSEAAKEEWPGYGWQGRWLTWVMCQFTRLPCHIVIIGHENQYEKRRRTIENGKPVEKILWTRRQPLSSSNPHGMNLASYVEEIYYFYRQGIDSRIEPFGDKYEEGGSRVLPRQSLAWKDYPAGRVFEMLGTPKPDPNLAPWQYPISDMPTPEQMMQSRTAMKRNLAANSGNPRPAQPVPSRNAAPLIRPPNPTLTGTAK